MSDFTNITLNEMPLEGLLKQGGRFDNSMRVVAKPSGSAREETEMAELKAQGVCDFCGEACNADMQGAKAYDCDDFPHADDRRDVIRLVGRMPSLRGTHRLRTVAGT